MRWILPILIAIHVVPGVFWAGSTFVLSRSGGIGAEPLAYPQVGAATVTVLAGAVLWGLMHGTGFARLEHVLALGAVCAVVAVGIQSGIGLPATRRLNTTSGVEGENLRTRIAVSQHAAAGLLVIAVICMVVARYV